MWPIPHGLMWQWLPGTQGGQGCGSANPWQCAEHGPAQTSKIKASPQMLRPCDVHGPVHHVLPLQRGRTSSRAARYASLLRSRGCSLGRLRCGLGGCLLLRLVAAVRRVLLDLGCRCDMAGGTGTFVLRKAHHQGLHAHARSLVMGG